MANVNIPDLAALTAPAATDEIEVYDASAAANVRLALSYVALTGTANVFTAANTFSAGLLVTGGVYAAGKVYRTASDGTLIGSYPGSTNDFVLINGYGVSVFEVPTNTNSMRTYGHVLVGTPTDAAQLTVNGAMALVDGMTAPGTTSGWAKIYVDSADGDLKVKFGDGTTKTIMTDT
jgi:hypothetical protein